ncbi:hypothetical protein F441_05024 [Phytophthora nicotianae CJ01A1]|uniref:Uncharacterized protein n=4 Tax=Phytophthora nicotianae TaxID=4792 RepID=W2QIM8_PHYN3|nr:hypothetical protein PPTG_22485 [Phytophthora nicotianae INRA-310]ETI51659.1 hypothetical protein F443_05018 [Phytophthora nicotianae P1569]ETK91585.1 hypothetical protein L915_04888 [Phytophthora nicotianae]ETP21442.1 hypothetical protein F441_05024 [Phytophthora nicotianae CJ01A1]ETL98150.1 hypothetical protein L917_04734 [Phytophthora nicotianae]ETM51292.1 hypothetical protein L914_04840 [Phytophthora nicotianae]
MNSSVSFHSGGSDALPLCSPNNLVNSTASAGHGELLCLAHELEVAALGCPSKHSSSDSLTTIRLHALPMQLTMAQRLRQHVQIGMRGTAQVTELMGAEKNPCGRGMTSIQCCCIDNSYLQRCQGDHRALESARTSRASLQGNSSPAP